MHIFDRIDPWLLERRNAQLWNLAISVIVILSTGFALLLYPSAFQREVSLSGREMQRVFFSFCVISVLTVSYLVDRQVAIRQLRRRLREEETRNGRLLLQTSMELLDNLPNFEHFQDRLAMEFRRSTIGLQPLSLIVVSLTPHIFANSSELSTVYGDAVKSIIQRMRAEDSLYRIRTGVFGVILPAASTADANRVSGRLAESIELASGPGQRFSFELKVINYPEQASSAHELESLAKNAFPREAALAKAA